MQFPIGTAPGEAKKNMVANISHMRNEDEAGLAYHFRLTKRTKIPNQSRNYELPTALKDLPHFEKKLIFIKLIKVMGSNIGAGRKRFGKLTQTTRLNFWFCLNNFN